jgi:NADP-dependent aldehyde dehydrogenase
LTIHGQHLIAGSRQSRGRRTFTAVDPSSGRPLPSVFHDATPEEIDAALSAAAEAFEQYRRVDGTRIAAFLDAIATELEAAGEELIATAHSETGLPVARLQGERNRMIGGVRIFAQLARDGSWVSARIDRPDPARTPLPKPDVRTMLTAIGPVVVFGASNFPLAISVAGNDTMSALAAGCPVVVKAHPAHPATGEIAGEAIARAAAASRMPAGVFSLVHGVSHEVGLALARHPATRAVAFTGSIAGGRALFDAAAARPEPIPVYAEMGSVNPVFVLPGALR